MIVKEGQSALNYYLILDGEVEISRIDHEKAEAAKIKTKTRDAKFLEGGKVAALALDNKEYLEQKKQREELEAEIEKSYRIVLGTQASGGIVLFF